MASASMHIETVNEDDIDNDLLIKEVKKRPVLFDKKLKDYFNLNLKIEGWEEITRIIFSSSWDSLSSRQKTLRGKLVRKRWKNIRACFSREIRERKSIKSVPLNKKKKKYKYFDYLSFLLPNATTRESSRKAGRQENDCQEDSGDTDEDLPQRIKHIQRKKTNKTPCEKRLLDILNKNKVDEKKLIEILNKNKNRCCDDEKEKYFALALVPLLKAVPEKDKLQVQIKILQVFHDAQNQNSHKMMQSSHSSQQPGPSGPGEFGRRSSKQRNYSPVYVIPSTSPQHSQIKPKCFVSLPLPSAQNPEYHSYLSSPDNSSAASVTSNSVKSCVSQFTIDEDSDVKDICQDCNIYTENP